MNLRFLLIVLLGHFSLVVFSQTNHVIVGGYVKEEGSSEALYGVTIYSPLTGTGTATNAYGYFSISLPLFTDSLELKVAYVGYKPKSIFIKPTQNTILKIELQPVLLEEVVVNSDESESISKSLQMSTITLTGTQVKDMPAFLGEKDVLKTLQLMPGVQKGTEGSNGIYVRGGGPDQNLVILDDAPIYNVSHLFGFFSIFNGDAIKNVSLMKGGFPAKYGGRLSSVIEMNMKDGNKEKIHGEVGLGLLSSRFMLEGPIKKGKSSFLIAGRRTYFDILSKPFLKNGNKIGYYFYDLNMKYNYELSTKNKIFISAYLGKDRFFAATNTETSERKGFDEEITKSENKGQLYWGNSMATVRWNHLFGKRLFVNTSFILSQYKFFIETGYSNTNQTTNENTSYRSKYNSGITDVTGKVDFNYNPNVRNEIRFGAMYTWHRFTPGAYSSEENNVSLVDRTNKVDAIEVAAYVEDNINVTENFKVNAGVRLTGFQAKGETYQNAEPRLALAYSITNTLSVKASYALMNQYIHLLSNTGIGLPTDLWVPTTNIIKPQQSNQVALGLAKDIVKHNLLISLEGYYKKMDRVVGYKEGASYLDTKVDVAPQDYRWERNVTQGQAWSYGAEFLVQKKVGKWSGWVGYTLSWTQMQFDEVNLGRKFWARYDRRHDISVVAIYKPSKRITLSAVWVYATGNAYTLPNNKFQLPQDPKLNDNGGLYYYGGVKDVSDYGQKNNYRMASYHRLDLGIQFHKERKRFIRTWDIGIYNVYNRANPFAYVAEYNSSTQRYSLNQISIFPIIPSVTYNIKF